ncbi:hypothetical protein [Bacillus sp. Hm123]|uniref:hypothetical protein n=1 Tax=Bacillus sp. Hm123 TaxID=3450745 RepID=UPI003F429D5B
MKKWFINLLNSVLNGVLTRIIITLLFALPLFTVLMEYIKTGEWALPDWNWPIIIAVAILLFFLNKFYKKVQRRKSIRSYRRRSRTISSIGQWDKVAEERFYEVDWSIRVPSHLSYQRVFDANEGDKIINQINVQTPPHCPNCSTDLEEVTSYFGNFFLGRYIWKCIACGFKTRSSHDFYETAERVKRIAKGQARKELKELDSSRRRV